MEIEIMKIKKIQKYFNLLVKINYCILIYFKQTFVFTEYTSINIYFAKILEILLLLKQGINFQSMF